MPNDLATPAIDLTATRAHIAHALAHCAIVSLDDALYAVSGDDAAAFLHAQLTNDMQAMKVGDVRLAGWCTPKGRLLVLFRVIRTGEGFLLVMPKDIHEAIVKRLKMFVLRSKVTIEPLMESHALLGVAGPEAASVLASGKVTVPEKEGSSSINAMIVARLSSERILLAAPLAAMHSLREQLTGAAVAATRAVWDYFAIMAGEPSISAATQDAFVPQMVNLELLDGVNFKKGCYPGQEIVARTQYLGKNKRRMVIVEGTHPMHAGDSVASARFGEQAAGQIVLAAPKPDAGYVALVSAQLEAIAANDLTHAGEVLTVRRPPQAIPELA